MEAHNLTLNMGTTTAIFQEKKRKILTRILINRSVPGIYSSH